MKWKVNHPKLKERLETSVRTHEFQETLIGNGSKKEMLQDFINGLTESGTWVSEKGMIYL